MEYQPFSPAICEKLGYYVYRLVDPDTGETFYIGKGTGNRLFAHLNDAIAETKEQARLDRIRAIHSQGKKVHHIIHRHGLTEKEAYEVESALIDMLGLTELTNLVMGHHAHERGQMTVEEVIAQYDAPTIPIEVPAILIIINRRYQRGMNPSELYEATRGSWVIGKRRDKAQYAFSTSKGLVRQVYRIESWYPTPNHDRRWQFDGTIAEEMQHYVGSDIRQYLTKGAQNPILYINC